MTSALLTLGAHPAEPPAFARLSAEQAQALVHDVELAVVAGAGAGKTSTLAARYVLLHHTLIQALGEAPPPQAVLVLTFTERAATEMRERCSAMVEAMGAACAMAAREAAPELRAAFAKRAAAWHRVRDRLPGAAIHTFHAFCARLLREFPAETGTVPGAAPLDDPATRRRLAEAAMGAALAEAEAGSPEAAVLLATFGGVGGVAAVLGELLGRRGELREAIAQAAHAPVDDAAIFAASGFTPAQVELGLARWQHLVQRIVDTTKRGNSAWLNELRGQLERVKAPASADTLERAELWAEALRRLAGSSTVVRILSHSSAMGVKADYGGEHAAAVAALKELQAEADAFAPEVAACDTIPNRHDRVLVEVRQSLARLAQEAERRLVAGFDARAELDFAEIIARARRAVVEGGLAAPLRERHRYVMVDEFQDTDVDQWAIVAAITRPEGAEDRLFVVGDPKQAIYGFRGGDVAVFERARRTLTRSCVFADNHRSRPAVVAFVNRAFSRVLARPPGASGLWNVGYDAMRAASDREGGSVVLATAPPVKPQMAGTLAEAKWIAETIRDRILPGVGPWAGSALLDRTKHPQPPIAILLRRRKHLAEFEAALAAAGVPCLVADGTGFWSRPEVLDLAHTLRALTSGEPASVVAALRSPLFGVRDRALVLLARAERLADFGEGPLPERLAADPDLPGAWARWAALRPRVRACGVAGALEAVLAEAHAAWLLALQTPDGRAEANVQQLLARADEAEAAGVAPAAFARDMLDRASEATREAEAALPDSGVRVVLLTVHASKGLEWPVVIVPELGVALRTSRSGRLTLARDDEGRWEFATSVLDRYGPMIGRTEPSALARAKRRAAELELAEARRVFYVACTRARDHLVLVGHGDEAEEAARAEPRSWLGMLATAEVDDAVIRERIGGDEEEGETTAALVAPAVAPPEAVDVAALRRSLQPFVAHAVVAVSPSGLDERFHEAGLGERPAPPRSTGEAMRRDVAAVRGTVVHGLLEDESLWNEALAAERWRAEALGAGLSLAEVEAEWPGLLAQLRTMRESPDVLAVLDARGASELPVRLDLGALRVEGRIDRLVQDHGGEHGPAGWMVVDYKTEDPGPDPLAAALRHRSQLLAYSLAASAVLEANGQGPVRRGGVVFTRTGTLVRLPDWSEEDRSSFLDRLAQLAAKSASAGVSAAPSPPRAG